MANNTGYDKTPVPAPDYDVSKVPEPIRRRSNWTRTKFTGQDVLESVAQTGEIAGLYAGEAKQLAERTQYRQDAVEDFNAQVIQEMTDKDVISAPELIESRDGEDKLSARLDRDFDEVSNRVAETNDRVSDVFYINDFPRLAPEISDSLRIQRAIDAMVNGGVLSLKSGEEYTFATKVFANNGNVILNGNNSIINVTGNMDYAFDFDGGNNLIFDLKFKKEKENTTIGAILMKGLQNTISQVSSRDSVWKKFIHGVGMKESHLSGIRVDNDTADSSNSTGTVIWLDYSVNITISGSMIGFCKTGIYLSNVADPNNGNWCEGVLTYGIIYVFCDTAVRADNSTFLTVTNSVLDFCGVAGVVTINGNSSVISGNWIKTLKAGTAITAHTNFDRAKIFGNTILGEDGVSGQSAFSVAAQRSIVKDNTIGQMDGGVVTSSSSIEKDNIVTNGTPIVSPKKETITHYTGVATAVMFNKSNTLIELEVWERGSSNYLYAKGFKGVTGIDVHTLNVVASSGLTLGAKNNLGTQVIEGYGTLANLIIRTKETTI